MLFQFFKQRCGSCCHCLESKLLSIRKNILRSTVIIQSISKVFVPSTVFFEPLDMLKLGRAPEWCGMLVKSRSKNLVLCTDRAVRV